MKILVTGATGFLGRKLCNHLSHLGYRVTATGRNEAIGFKLQNKNVVFIAGDLTDLNSTNRLCRNQDAIIHCAALSTVWAKYSAFYEANVLAVKNLIVSANQQQVPHFIQVSTPSIYIGAAAKEQISEITPLPSKLINAYAYTKKMGEDLLLNKTQNQCQTTIIRPQGIFGPQDTSIVPRLLAINDTYGIPLINKGQHLVDLTYVDNVVHALELCLKLKPKPYADIYNISNGEPVIFIEFLKKLFERIKHPLICNARSYDVLQWIARFCEMGYTLFKINKEPPITKYTLSLISESRTLDITAAKNTLGYRPQVSIEEGIERYARWYLSERQ